MLDVAAALEANEQFIVLENDADVEAAREAGYDEALVARLALKPSKACISQNSRNLLFFWEIIYVFNVLFYLLG